MAGLRTIRGGHFLFEGKSRSESGEEKEKHSSVTSCKGRNHLAGPASNVFSSIIKHGISDKKGSFIRTKFVCRLNRKYTSASSAAQILI